MFIKTLAQLTVKSLMLVIKNKDIINIAIHEAESVIKKAKAGTDRKKLAIDIALNLVIKFAPVPIPEPIKSLVLSMIVDKISDEIEKFFNNKKEVLS